MRWLRSLEILAWTAGVSLLSTYAVTRSWYVHSGEQSLAVFDALRSDLEQAEPPAARSLAKPEATDMSTWSPERIARYRAAATLAAIPKAVLRIPSLQLVVPVFEGTSEESLNRGAGRIEGTARIGESGNIGIAAHRDGFFRALKDVRVGDVLLLERLGGTDSYRITATSIVEPADVRVLAATTTHAVTLVTCYPFYYVGAAPRRFIVRAEKTPASKRPAGVKSRVA